MEDIFKKLTEKIITKEELIFYLQEINSIQRIIFKNINTPLSEKAKGKIREESIKKLQELEEKKIILKNPEKNRIFFEELKKYLQSIPQLKITIAFHPEKKFINKIYSWLRKEMNQKIILDFIFNPKIIGGIIIEYQGKQLNLSLAKKIDELRKPKTE